MKKPLLPLVIVAVALWTSALTLFVVGTLKPELSVLRWAALADALVAGGFTAYVADRMFRG
jgi:hypothetical protein